MTTNPDETSVDATSTPAPMPPKVLRRAGEVSDEQVAAFAAELARHMLVTGDGVHESFRAAELCALVDYDHSAKCDPPWCIETAEAEREEERAFAAVVVAHLRESGAIIAAVRHALATSTVELPPPELGEHATFEEITALVLCSEVLGVVKRDHLPRAEQIRLVNHATACSECGPRLDFATDVAYGAVNLAVPTATLTRSHPTTQQPRPDSPMPD